MSITHYFLQRPVLAIVLNALLIIVGILCFTSLPVREYPNVHFPSITVSAFYPNASAELVETSVTNILEDRLAGIEGLETISSQSRYGSSFITLQLRQNTSLDRALFAIREAIDLARDQLPPEVRDPIVERKINSDGMPFIALSLESSSMDFAALTHYANLNLKNVFRSLTGVASVDVWGQPYTYQILLNAHSMYTLGINADDVFDALKRSNLSLPVGKFQNVIPVTLNTELSTRADYENLVIKERKPLAGTMPQNPILLKDVATIALKNNDELFRVRINGKPGLVIAIDRANDANPLEVSDLVHAELTRLKKSLPTGLNINMILDQADFVRHSLNTIQHSIIEAVIFVLLIVFLFLRNVRATLVPLVTIPISLLGSLLFLKVFGYSLNIMTMLAMVLAVGLVVDDAIVVLENIQRYREKGLAPFDAACKGAQEISFAIIAMTLILTSVYAPLAFISGTVGHLFTEFAVALAGSVLISGIVALTLSPLMCSKTLSHNPRHLWPKLDLFLQKMSDGYQRALVQTISYKKTCLLLMLFAISMVIFLAQQIPSETAPKEDRSLLGVYIPPISGTTIDGLEATVKKVEKELANIPESAHLLTFMGEWGGQVLLPLKPPLQRQRSATAIVDAIRPWASRLPSVDVHPWSWESGLPSVDNASTESALSLVIGSTDSYRDLFQEVEKVKALLDKEKIFNGVRHDLKFNTPGYKIDMDANELAQLHLTSSQVAKTIEVFFSGDQSLSFAKDGIRYPLTLKGNGSPWTLDELYVTNSVEKRVSLGTVATLVPTVQPHTLYHYNQMRSAIVSVDKPSHHTIAESMPMLLNRVKAILPSHYKISWQGAIKAYSEARIEIIVLFCLALVSVFSILAIQFENFIDPFIIILTVPLACSCALACCWILNQTLNVYTQVGIITLIGLITKHGILIVEFANTLAKQGVPLVDAVVHASALRLRPILMTTGAMLFGTIPLVLARDVGYESRYAIGTMLIGGLSFGTLLTLFVLPTLYWMVKSWRGFR